MRWRVWKTDIFKASQMDNVGGGGMQVNWTPINLQILGTNKIYNTSRKRLIYAQRLVLKEKLDDRCKWNSLTSQNSVHIAQIVCHIHSFLHLSVIMWQFHLYLEPSSGRTSAIEVINWPGTRKLAGQKHLSISQPHPSPVLSLDAVSFHGHLCFALLLCQNSTTHSQTTQAVHESRR